MATANPFDLLGDDDNDDPAQLIAFHEQKIAAKRSAAAAAPAPAVAKLPTKPLPPAQAVREARGGGAMARGGRGVGLRGRGGRGGGYVPNRDFGNGTADGFSAGSGGGGGGGWGEEGDRSGDRERSGYGGERGGYGGERGGYGGERGGYGGDRSGGYGGERGGYGGDRGGYGAERGGYGGERGGYGGYRGGRRGGYGNVEEGEDGRPVRRMYERRSGTGRGFETKRDGAGRGNWGTVDDAIAQESEELVNKEDKVLDVDKENEHEKSPENIQDKEPAELENKEKEEEDKEMTLEEYEKVREEKRKALLASKPEERKVDIDKELKAMQLLAVKKGKDDVFIKLGSEKESRKQKENAERETSKKSLSINEFLKPADGGYYNPAGRGRGRGRGRGERGAGRGDFGRGGYSPSAPAPEVAIPITDPGQFPALGGK